MGRPPETASAEVPHAVARCLARSLQPLRRPRDDVNARRRLPPETTREQALHAAPPALLDRAVHTESAPSAKVQCQSRPARPLSAAVWMA